MGLNKIKNKLWRPLVALLVWSVWSCSAPTVPDGDKIGIEDQVEARLSSFKNHTHCVESSNCGFFTDDRDGKEYGWAKIGNQVWMAENLAYLPEVSGTDFSKTQAKYYVYDFVNVDLTEAKGDSTYLFYGALYNWAAVMDGATATSAAPSGVAGICPADWHIPSRDEWQEMLDYLGGIKVAGKKLQHGLEWSSAGQNSYAFSALPNGYFKQENFMGLGNESGFAQWWSTTEDLANFYSSLKIDAQGQASWQANNSGIGLAVRCVKNSAGTSSSSVASSSSAGRSSSSSVAGSDSGVSSSSDTGATDDASSSSATGTVYEPVPCDDFDGDTHFCDDREGRIYAKVQIGAQLWMAENLAYLPLVHAGDDYAEKSARYYVYGFEGTDLAAARTNENYEQYGVLYNWAAATGGESICPAGWKLPSSADWDDLVAQVQNQASQLKDKNAWSFIKGTDNFGFKGLPAGWNDIDGFDGLGQHAYWWAANGVKYYGLSYNYTALTSGAVFEEFGLAVRCIAQ